MGIILVSKGALKMQNWKMQDQKIREIIGLRFQRERVSTGYKMHDWKLRERVRT